MMRRVISYLLLTLMMFSLFPAMPVQAAATPVITGVNPSIVPAKDGGDIMIYGTDLGGAGTKVVLQIGAEIMILEGDAIRLATPSLVIVKVPGHAVDATGIKQVNSLVVSNSNGSSAPKANPFRYMETPEVSHSYPFTTVSKYDDSGNPSQIETDKKTYLKIEGGFFDWVDKVYLKEKDTPDGSALKFGSFTDATGPLYRDEADGGIYIEVTNILRGKTVQVKAENVGGYSSPWADSIYYNVPGPYITTFYPNPNPIFVGSSFDMSGANFLNGDAANTRVYIGGVKADVKEVLSGSIKVTVPNPQPGNRDLKIEVWDGGVRQGVAIYKNALTIKVIPTGIKLEQVLPNHGPINGGNQVIVVGEKFDQTMTVAFEIEGHTTMAVACETVEPPAYLPVGKTAFEVTVPPSYQGRQGAVIVKIIDRNQPTLIFDQKPNLYFYSTASQYLDLQSISPKSIPFDQPTSIRLDGQYFSYFRRENSIKRLELPDGTVKDIGDPNNIDIGDPGANQIKLIEEIPGYYQNQTFRIERMILVTAGGVTASIKALNNVGNVQYLTADSGFYPLGDKASEKIGVDINISETTFYLDNGKWKECIDSTIYPLQEVDSLPDALTVTRSYPDPEITSITPNWGPNLRSQEVLIQGYNFYEGVTVTFGGQKTTILAIERGGFTPGKGVLITLRVTVPTSVKRGDVDVIIANTDDKFASEKYTYVSSPVISEISPALGPLTGGNHITVSGEQFMFGSGVLIGDTVVCSADTQVAMESLINNVKFKEAVLGSDRPLELVVDSGYRVIGVDGSELQSYDNRPDGVKIILEVPRGVTLGKKDVYVFNIDRGWNSVLQGFQYIAVTGTPITITVQPNEGNVEGGEEIVITGIGGGFLPQVYAPSTGYGVIVTIDGVVANIMKIADANHKLTVTTPPGSRVEQWTPVEVLNISPEGIRLDVNEEGFRYHRVLTLPQIIDFAPRHGQAGTMVKVFGQDFSVDPNTQILFGDQILSQSTDQVKVINSRTIIFPVPTNDTQGNLLPPGLYDIQVKNPDTGTATAAEKFYLQVPNSRPRIEDIDGDGIAIRPDKGSVSGGADIVVEGYDFYQGLELYLGGRPATNVQVQLLEYDSISGVWSRCLIRAKTPALPQGEIPGKVDVMVVNPDGGTINVIDAFTYVIPSSSPVIDTVQPNKGSSAGNLEVVITGSDFGIERDADNKIVAWPTVTFGGYSAVVIKDDTITRTQRRQIRVTTPAYPGGGKVDVTITNPDTGTYTKSGAFTFEVSNPSITKVVPDKFSRYHSSWGLIIGSQFVAPRTEPDPINPGNSITTPGTDVLLSNQSGSLFTSLAGQTTLDGVTFDNIQVISETQIRVIIPPSERMGARTLRIKNPDGGQTDYAIEYVSPVDEPQITAIDPAQGSFKGGTNVTISGSNFADRLEVYFGGQAATVLEKSPTQLVVRTPAITMSAEEDQRVVDVSVINTTNYGSVVKVNGFTYLRVESQIAINEINPDKGTTQGGTTVIISGENFRSGCQVFFGTTEASVVTYNSSTQLTVVTPPHSKGSVDVSVRNPAPDHAEAIKSGGFTFEETIAPVPTDFDGQIWNQRAIRLYWTASEVPSQYEIYVNNSSNLESSEYLGATGRNEYMFEDIDAGRYYYFWMRTINRDGTSKFAACKANPIYVSSSDVTNRPPTATVDTLNTQIDLTEDELKIIVGEDLVFWRYPIYEILLDANQRSSRQIELLIPSEGIDKNSVTAIRVVSNNFKLDLPVKALNTFEYQEFRRNNAEFYVILRLVPAPASYLESLALNLPGHQAVSGFDVMASMQSPIREAGMSLFASDLNVAWLNGGTPLTPLRAYGYDSYSRKWSDVTAFVDTASGQVTAGVGRSDTYIICR